MDREDPLCWLQVVDQDIESVGVTHYKATLHIDFWGENYIYKQSLTHFCHLSAQLLTVQRPHQIWTCWPSLQVKPIVWLCLCVSVCFVRRFSHGKLVYFGDVLTEFVSALLLGDHSVWNEATFHPFHLPGVWRDASFSCVDRLVGVQDHLLVARDFCVWCQVVFDIRLLLSLPSVGTIVAQFWNDLGFTFNDFFWQVGMRCFGPSLNSFKNHIFRPRIHPERWIRHEVSIRDRHFRFRSFPLVFHFCFRQECHVLFLFWQAQTTGRPTLCGLHRRLRS